MDTTAVVSRLQQEVLEVREELQTERERAAAAAAAAQSSEAAALQARQQRSAAEAEAAAAAAEALRAEVSSVKADVSQWRSQAKALGRDNADLKAKLEKQQQVGGRGGWGTVAWVGGRVGGWVVEWVGAWWVGVECGRVNRSWLVVGGVGGWVVVDG